MKRLLLLSCIAAALAWPALAQKPYIYDAPPNGRTPPPSDTFETRELSSDWGYIEVYQQGAKEPSTIEVRNHSTGKVYSREDIRASGLSVHEFIRSLEAKDFAAQRAPKSEPSPPSAVDEAKPLEVLPAPPKGNQ